MPRKVQRESNWRAQSSWRRQEPEAIKPAEKDNAVAPVVDRQPVHVAASRSRQNPTDQNLPKLPKTRNKATKTLSAEQNSAGAPIPDRRHVNLAPASSSQNRTDQNLPKCSESRERASKALAAEPQLSRCRGSFELLKRPENAKMDIRMLYPHGHTSTQVNAVAQAAPDRPEVHRNEVHNEQEMYTRVEPSERREHISKWLDECERDGLEGYLGNIGYFNESEEISIISSSEEEAIQPLENSECLEEGRRRRWFELNPFNS